MTLDDLKIEIEVCKLKFEISERGQCYEFTRKIFERFSYIQGK